MAGLIIEFRGVQTLINRLDIFEQLLREEAVTALHEGGAFMHARAQEHAAVDSGFMRDHIREDYDDQALAADVGCHEEDFVGHVNPKGKLITALYPVFVEYGTVKMAPQPFLGPAATESEQSFADAVQRAMQRALERAAGAV